MTVQTPEAVDLADLGSLDFRTPQLCEWEDCWTDKITAEVAVALLVRQMPCCTQAGPVCAKHLRDVRQVQADHRAEMCLAHRVIICSHVAFRIEPLT